MIIQIIRFKSGLSQDEINRHFIERSDRYRKVPGLLQKYYVKFSDTGEYGGIYLWDSPESLDKSRSSNLSGTLVQTYDIKGEPARELAEVMLTLHEELTEPSGYHKR